MSNEPTVDISSDHQRTCELCNRKYKIKKNYDNHVFICKFVNMTRQLSDDETNDPTPPVRDLYKLIQYLSRQCQDLRTEVNILKSSANSGRSRQVKDLLHVKTSVQIKVTFMEWLRKIQVTRAQIEHVFHSDLLSGMKICLQENLTSSEPLPICAFPQKADTIFIHTLDENRKSQWIRMSDEDADQLHAHLSHQFLKEFMNWQTANFSFDKSEQEKEQNIQYMIKINGGTMKEKRRRQELRKWLYTILTKPT